MAPNIWGGAAQQKVRFLPKLEQNWQPPYPYLIRLQYGGRDILKFTPSLQCETALISKCFLWCVSECHPTSFWWNIHAASTTFADSTNQPNRARATWNGTPVNSIIGKQERNNIRFRLNCEHVSLSTMYLHLYDQALYAFILTFMQLYTCTVCWKNWHQ